MTKEQRAMQLKAARMQALLNDMITAHDKLLPIDYALRLPLLAQSWVSRAKIILRS